MRAFFLAASAAAFAAACDNNQSSSENTGAAPQNAASDEAPGAEAPIAAAKATADSSRLEADVRFLADDLLEGREAGTRGFELAASYVAERYRAMGLAPGGDNGTYLQNVPMRADKAANPEGGTLTLAGPNAPADIVRGVDYLVGSTNKATESSITAPLVFVGFGFASEDYDRDDYEGLDVDGKIVVYLAGAPKFLQSEERAHYNITRGKRASDHGAIGAIALWTPELEERYSFQRGVDSIAHDTDMGWVDANGEPYSTAPNLRNTAALSLAGAEKLFAGAPSSFDEILAAADQDAGAVQGFDLGVTATISQRSVHSTIETPNVVAILPGSDPALKDEYVVLTAHLDHEGIKPTPEEGDDEIYNGAMDNAAGTATLLEAAHLLAQNPPRRSIVFVALTAEEKGLVGSSYYANNPTVPADGIVANVNLDMPIVTYDFTDIIAFGAERSTLFPIVETAAARANLTLSPDPQPEQGFFTRSDQYSFVKTGVPAIFVKTGFANGGEEAQGVFRKEHYHRVSDHADLLNYGALQRFAQVNYEIADGIGNMEVRPLWKKDDFFARTFGGPMED